VLTLLALIIIGISLFATDVYAEHRDITVDFDRLDVEVRRGAVTVDYEIERPDWRRMRHAGIEPRLYLYEVGRRGHDRYLYSVELDHREARIRYPRHVTPGKAKRVRFRLVGRHRGVEITGMRHGSSCGEKVTVAVKHPRHRKRRHRPRRHAEPWRAELVKACSDATYSSDDVAECIEKGSKLRADAPRVIEACDEATYSSSDLVGCVERTGQIRRNRVGVVKACSKNTYWSDGFNQCLTDVASYRGNAAPIIDACADATYWSDAFHVCLREARGLGREAASVVRACGDGTYWQDAFNSCVRAANHRRRG
jgi:hypothetical protein